MYIYIYIYMYIYIHIYIYIYIFIYTYIYTYIHIYIYIYIYIVHVYLTSCRYILDQALSLKSFHTVQACRLAQDTDEAALRLDRKIVSLRATAGIESHPSKGEVLGRPIQNAEIVLRYFLCVCVLLRAFLELPAFIVSA